MGKGRKNWEEKARKSLDCHECSTKGKSSEGSQEDPRTRESLNIRDYLIGYDQNVGRNKDGKGHSDEISDGIGK